MRGFGLLLFEELHFMLGSELSQADFVGQVVSSIPHGLYYCVRVLLPF